MNTGHLYNVSARKILKKMGFTADQDGIINRYMAEKGNWNDHLINTKNFIIECLTETDLQSVAILGSGWFLDIPASFLAEKFEMVYFFDIRHPEAIRYKYRKEKKFKFIEMDLTGGLIDQIFTFLNNNKKPKFQELLNALEFRPVSLPVPSDYLISLNILNQLDILIIDYLEKTLHATLENSNIIRKNIQQQHINLLKSRSSCLITDIEEINLTKDKDLIEIKPLIFADIPDGTGQKEWLWHFDTRMTYHQGCITYFKVQATKF